MSRILYIQNGEHDHPGLFGRVVAENGAALDVVHAWQGEPVPTVPNGWSGIVVGGGYMGAYETEEFPFLKDEMRLIQASHEADRPVLGMCLGAQLIAAALGGKVYPHAHKEIGFHDVYFTLEAESDPLWKGTPHTFQPVHWHGDTFSLPPDSILLASSKLTPNQLFRAGRSVYGVQFHLEIDLPVLTDMVETDNGWLPTNGVEPVELLLEATSALPKIEPIARKVFTRWTSLLS